MLRLNKIIARAGICSRRKADSYIKQGRVCVNGTLIRDLGVQVKETDNIEFNGKKIQAQNYVYIILNKPKGYITTLDDPLNRKIVTDLITPDRKIKNYDEVKFKRIYNDSLSIKARICPVGRLDRNTSGLLILTNDGNLSQALSHPSFNVRKTYEVYLDKVLSSDDLQSIKDGLKLEDGIVKVDKILTYKSQGNRVTLTLHSGKNRIIRRMFESLNYEITRLDRIGYSILSTKKLPRSKWRYLNNYEIQLLKK